MDLEEAIQNSNQANIKRFRERYHQGSKLLGAISYLAFATRCNQDEKAIRQCFEARPGDPLNKLGKRR